MDPLSMGVAAGGQVLGNVVGGLMGASAADSANAKRWEQQMFDYWWREKQAQSAHQYEVADLRKAGLNPVLSANGGASIPGASSSQVGEANPGSGVGPGLGAGINSAMAVKGLENSTKSTDAQAQAATSAASASDASAKLSLARAQTEISNNKLVKNRADSAEVEAKLDKELRQSERLTDIGAKAIGGASDVLNMLPRRGGRGLGGSPGGGSYPRSYRHGNSQDVKDFLKRTEELEMRRGSPVFD